MIKGKRYDYYNRVKVTQQLLFTLIFPTSNLNNVLDSRKLFKTEDEIRYAIVNILLNVYGK